MELLLGKLPVEWVFM